MLAAGRLGKYAHRRFVGWARTCGDLGAEARKKGRGRGLVYAWSTPNLSGWEAKERRKCGRMSWELEEDKAPLCLLTLE